MPNKKVVFVTDKQAHAYDFKTEYDHFPIDARIPDRDVVAIPICGHKGLAEAFDNGYECDFAMTTYEEWGKHFGRSALFNRDFKIVKFRDLKKEFDKGKSLFVKPHKSHKLFFGGAFNNYSDFCKYVDIEPNVPFTLDTELVVASEKVADRPTARIFVVGNKAVTDVKNLFTYTYIQNATQLRSKLRATMNRHAKNLPVPNLCIDYIFC